MGFYKALAKAFNESTDSYTDDKAGNALIKKVLSSCSSELETASLIEKEILEAKRSKKLAKHLEVIQLACAVFLSGTEEVKKAYDHFEPEPAARSPLVGRGTCVYLAGPIDLEDAETAVEWRQDVSLQLSENGISSFLPTGAYVFAGGKVAADWVITTNMFALINSDYAIFLIPGDVVSVGTAMELAKVVELGKPHVIVSDFECLAFRRSVVVKTMDEAVEFIIRTNNAAQPV